MADPRYQEPKRNEDREIVHTHCPVCLRELVRSSHTESPLGIGRYSLYGICPSPPDVCGNTDYIYMGGRNG